jgi:hypothetical protein
VHILYSSYSFCWEKKIKFWHWLFNFPPQYKKITQFLRFHSTKFLFI